MLKYWSIEISTTPTWVEEQQWRVFVSKGAYSHPTTSFRSVYIYIHVARDERAFSFAHQPHSWHRLLTNHTPATVMHLTVDSCNEAETCRIGRSPTLLCCVAEYCTLFFWHRIKWCVSRYTLKKSSQSTELRQIRQKKTYLNESHRHFGSLIVCIFAYCATLIRLRVVRQSLCPIKDNGYQRVMVLLLVFEQHKYPSKVHRELKRARVLDRMRIYNKQCSIRTCWAWVDILRVQKISFI